MRSRTNGVMLRVYPPLALTVARERWLLEGTECHAGEWVVVVPEEEGGEDLAAAVARLLATLSPPVEGSIDVLGEDPTRLSYLQLQTLRRRLGLVQSWGGLLSNRTLGENVALPAIVHGLPAGRRPEEAAVELMTKLGVAHLANARPHQVDRLTAWRARVARALILEPSWLVVEGAGDWVPSGSPAWGALGEAVERGAGGAVCLSRPVPALQQWLQARGGRVAGCRPSGEFSGSGKEERR